MERPSPLRWAAAVALIAAGCRSGDVALCLHDGFDSIDASRWTLMNPAHTDVTADGQLVIAPPAASNTNDGLRGTATYDLTGGFVEVQIAGYLTPSVNSQAELIAEIDDANHFYIGASYQSLVLRLTAAGTDSPDPVVALDPAVRYWRIAHDAATDTIEYQTSVDHVTWTTERAVSPPPFPITALRVHLEADSYNGGVAVPGAAAFDNLTFAAPACEAADHDLGLP